MSSSLLPSHVVDLADLAEIAPDSVHSRTLVSNDSGTVTLFGFGRGQGLSTHSAPFDALVQIISGQARVTIDDQDHELRSGQAILMPADIPHALHAITDFKMLLVMIKGR